MKTSLSNMSHGTNDPGSRMSSYSLRYLGTCAYKQK